MPKQLLAVVTLFFTFLLSVSSMAQFSQRGGISGIVSDESKAAIPGATVNLLDLARNQTVTRVTDAEGKYEFTQLLSGGYRVEIEAPGFKKSESDSIAVAEQASVRYDVQLQLGSVTQTVEVTTAAPLLEADHAALDQNINQQQINDLPINGRNYTSLAALTPGVSTTPRANINPGGTYDVGATFSSGGTQFAAGGSAEGSRDNGYYVNGVNVNENYQGSISFQPSAEAIGEVRIGIADFSAEYGRDITNFNASTKNGQNSFHGEAYDFIENDAFDALNPYDRVRALPGQAVKPAYRRNQFGGGVGGPVYIPRLLNLKTRAFFFANYERFPQSLAGGNNYAIVPSDAERAGNFAELCPGFDALGNCSDPTAQIYNPYTTTTTSSSFSRQPVPFNNLTLITTPNGAPAINPSSQGILNIFPHANTAKTVSNGGQNYQYSTVLAATSYHWDSRFDYRISGSDSAFVTWSQYHGKNNNSGSVFPEFISNVEDKAYLVTVDESHIFSANLANEFIFALGDGALVVPDTGEVSLLNSAKNPFNQVFSNTGAGANAGVMAVNVNGYATPGFNEYFRAENQSIQFSDNVNYVRGRHSIAIGFNALYKSERDFDSVRYVDFGCTGAYCGNGRDLFTSSGSDLGTVGGDAAADLLLGKPKVIHQRFTYSGASALAPEPNYEFPYYGAYFNDKMKLTSTLTLSFGLRYDLPIPLYATNNLCCAVYRAATDDLAIPGRAPGLAQHYLSAPKHDFAPRFSVAYSATPKLVARAGYGLYFNSGASQVSNALGAGGGTPGGFVGYEVTPTSLGANDQDPVTALSQIFPSSPVIALGTYPVSTGTGQGTFGAGQLTTVSTRDQGSTVTPYVHRFLLDLQRQVSTNSALTVTYLGALGRKGSFLADINVPAYQTNWPDYNTYLAARPYSAVNQNFGDIYVQRPGTNSAYHAGIVKYEHRMSHGIQFLTHYTYGKTISDYRLNGQGNAIGFNYPESILRYRGESTLSHRHRYLAQADYEPKYAQRLPSYLRPVLGDWHISAVGTYESGDKLTVTDQNDAAQDYAGGPHQPNVSRNPNFSRGKRTYLQYFDTTAFSEPTPGFRGNAGPGLVRGPGQENWDISFGKTLALYESFKLDLRADMFNAFNHTQWTSVDTVFNDTTSGNTFGQVTGGREGRIIELGAKLSF